MKAISWANEILSGIGIALGIDIATTKDFLGLILVGANILVLIISLVLKMIDWFKKAKEDGKITKDEVKEGVDIVNSGIEDINKQLEEKQPLEGEHKDDIQ